MTCCCLIRCVILGSDVRLKRGVWPSFDGTKREKRMIAMNYEVVELTEKTVIGLAARTSNQDPRMGQTIGLLWQRLFGGVYERIAHRADSHTIGLYSEYTDGAEGDYTVTVGCAVTKAQGQPEETVVQTIPAGRYAKFVVVGDQVEAVGNAWAEIWQLPLERTYTGDFEEYVSAAEDGQCEVHLYIAIAGEV